ncbi:MAG: hypothetical protein IPF68_08495 [Bacteroidales bacterium]|nr:hypothetical protein [Bacteroidales bacterium]
MLTAHVDVGILTDAVRKYLIDRITRPREFIDFLNKNSHLVLYGNPVEDDFRLLSRLLEGRGDSLIRKNTETSCCSIVPDINNPFQLFFASENKFSMEIQDNYFVASIEDYEEKFNELSSEKYFRIGDLVSETKLNSWNDLNSGVYLSDIILIDPFIANTDNEETLEKNLFEMLSIFSSNNFYVAY